MKDKVEFASEAWVRLAAQVLSSVVAEAGDLIAGQRISVCETFVNPPAHLRQSGSDAVAWAFSIDDGKATVIGRALESADYTGHADYQSALPGARTILGASAEEIEARAQARRVAVAAGAVKHRGRLDDATPAMRKVLTELHNRLAEKTA